MEVRGSVPHQPDSLVYGVSFRLAKTTFRFKVGRGVGSYSMSFQGFITRRVEFSIHGFTQSQRNPKGSLDGGRMLDQVWNSMEQVN